MRCAVLDDYQDVAAGMADWNRLPLDVEFLHDPVAPDALAERLAPFEVVVAMRERTRFDRALLDRLDRLRLLLTSGMVNAAIDLGHAASRGVVVSGTPGLAHPTAELTWALLLSLARHVPAEDALFHAGGPWQTTLGFDLAGRRLGLIGLGTVGRRVARYAAAFDMRISAWSRNLTDERCREAGVERATTLDALLREADVVSVHVVLGPDTRGLIGERQLALMRRTALLVNTSRGPIVEAGPLAEALRAGTIAGAALDVFEEEPLPPSHVLRSAPNLVATPHLGYVTEGNYRLYYGSIVEGIEAWLAGAPVRVLRP